MKSSVRNFSAMNPGVFGKHGGTMGSHHNRQFACQRKELEQKGGQRQVRNTCSGKN